MSTATLSDIITKVRRLTGTPNSQQLTDEQIIDYINSFYLYDFPAQFRSLQLEDMLTFNTIKGIDSYPFDFTHYETIEAPVYIDKRLVNLYNSPWSFYGLFFNWQEREKIAEGDGATVAYTHTIQNPPIIRSVNNNPIAQSVTSPTATFTTGSYPASFNEPNIARAQNLLIEANTTTGTLHVTDDGAGNLIGDTAAGGTVDYETGAIAGLSFTTAPASGSDINIHYSFANQSIPQAVLFWQNQLVVRPVPDRGYTVEITAFRRPSQVLLGTEDPSAPTSTGVPELKEWWETLAAGASKKIFEDRQDEGGIMNMDKMIQERLSDNETRTYAQIGKRQVGTIFADQLQGGGANNYRFWGNNG